MHAPDAYACSHQFSGRAPRGAGSDQGTYSDYLHLAELKALHHPRTQERAESRFIGLHHMAELLLSQQIEELELAITSLCEREPDVAAALTCLRRSRALTEQLTNLLTVLPGMISPAEFATFRDALGNASGMQSAQFWVIEILSGHRKTACQRLRALDASGEELRTLKRRLTSPNLWGAFLNVVGSRANDAEGLLDALTSGGPAAELANALRMHDLDWVRWRAQHAIMVEAMIGAVASGTGGTNGSRYLWSRVQTRFYPILHEATSLVHQHRAASS
ncbi:tryptophan 2,3-dioxygenase family protein [Saccharothrix sp. Mg75]|uniref:tryptophan 2,3-dioxygenase family protein n=1 Tax=Saccharothrix sp. Mg75 TaxID=3445357 RepID=UPI003EE88942